MDNHLEELKILFENHFGVVPSQCSRLMGAGSNRAYYRLEAINCDDVTGCDIIRDSGASNKLTAIGCYSDPSSECKAFIDLSRCFADHGINVPAIYGEKNQGEYILQQDLGQQDLFSIINSEKGMNLCRETMVQLARMQTIDAQEWMPCVAHPPFGERLVMWDLNYFKYDFLKTTGVAFDEGKLQDDFERFCSSLLNIADDQCGFMMRDCQSRNVMIFGGKPYFIDYQGGRKGPCIYDAISFIWQARAGFSPEVKSQLIDVWADEFSKLKGVEKHKLLAHQRDVVLFRLLQVLGAYGFRGLMERKAHFLSSIAAALNNLEYIYTLGWIDSYPEIKKVSEALIADKRLRMEPHEGLMVTVFSFSYKKGYPDDFSGNGGGFMFDCRAMHNPGRYDQYKQLTGLDQPVADFLEERGEVQQFLSTAWKLTDSAVYRYLQRGFSSLQIGFGCTGGQHRSVYCAQKTAEHIASLFPKAKVILVHREQGIRIQLRKIN